MDSIEAEKLSKFLENGLMTEGDCCKETIYDLIEEYYSLNTGLKSTAQQNINSTKNGNLHVK